jgi:ATP-dependent Lhr-like helicase
LPREEIELALVKLESEGFVMRGRFSPAALAARADEEWCERHLLARIHRYTLDRLRREIEPVPAQDFMRFLCDWQKLAPGARVSGPDALAGVLAQLEGYEAPAAAWETELLPARVADYSIGWLDELCTAGRIAWARLRGASAAGEAGRAAPVRNTPIALLPRRQLAVWNALTASRHEDAPPPSSRAQRVVEALERHGASFFDELLDDTHLLRAELEDALAELVARGRVHCDSFAGLRALLLPASRRRGGHGRHGRRRSVLGIEDSGRWTLARRDTRTDAAAVSQEQVEHVARVLLRRYGVVAWRLLEREAAWLPPWRELLRVYRRLEARGEIRGGRFVAGLSGEQFALPEAVGALRQVRKRPHDGALLRVSALDPLNLVGTVLPGERVPRHPGARLLLRDGLPVATLVAGQVEFAVELSARQQHDARRALLLDAVPSPAPAIAAPAS